MNNTDSHERVAKPHDRRYYATKWTCDDTDAKLSLGTYVQRVHAPPSIRQTLTVFPNGYRYVILSTM